MIKFFRKIRYDLIEKNKTGKYLKYAVGEIVLVVIGILIALQINNWNESHKSNREETTILKNLCENLKQAESQSTNFINAEEELVEDLIVALDIKSNKNQNDTTTFSNADFKKIVWDFVSSTTVINTYSDIKSTGKLSIIKNREIRESFNGLEVAINSLNELVADRLDVQQNRIDEIAVSEMNFIPLLGNRHPSLNVENEIANNYNLILSNPKTRNLLGIKLELTLDVLYLRKGLAIEIKRLIVLLETELEK
ncbi:MAG: hypothetical protein ACI865_002169 [Flavobacteriaceae bacterium]|jgi:hypothetical protein